MTVSLLGKDITKVNDIIGETEPNFAIMPECSRPWRPNKWSGTHFQKIVTKTGVLLKNWNSFNNFPKPPELTLSCSTKVR